MADQIKPQLHSSSLLTLYRCGERFRRKYIEGHKEPVGTPLIIGTATHSGIEIDLSQKIKKGFLMTKEMIQDVTRDTFIRHWQDSAILLNEDERFIGINKTRDRSQDMTIDMVTEYHYVLAPNINPKKVERNVVIEVKNYDYNLAGTIDVDEGESIRDTKTRKTNFGQIEVDRSEQYTFYALFKKVVDGIMPKLIWQDNIIKPTEKRGPVVKSYCSHRTVDDFKVAFRRFDQATKIIKAGAFMPASPTDWWCSPEFCGFALAGDCPFFNTRRILKDNPLIKQKENRKDERTTEQIIDSLTSVITGES